MVRWLERLRGYAIRSTNLLMRFIFTLSVLLIYYLGQSNIITRNALYHAVYMKSGHAKEMSPCFAHHNSYHSIKNLSRFYQEYKFFWPVFDLFQDLDYKVRNLELHNMIS